MAGRHFLNMLKAHTAAYKAIKAMPGTLRPRHRTSYRFPRGKAIGFPGEEI